MSDQLLSILMACGAVSALLIGVVDVGRARRGLCPAGQPAGLFILAACFAFMAWAIGQSS